MAFDIMHIDGEDLRGRVLEDRRAILADVVLRRPHPWLRLSDTTDGDGAYIWRTACEMGLEGIVSKRRGSRYVSGRFDGWCKTKCSTTEHFAVLGFDRGRRSLRLARLVEGELVPCGSAGTGLSVPTCARYVLPSTPDTPSLSRSNIAASPPPGSCGIPSSEAGIAANPRSHILPPFCPEDNLWAASKKYLGGVVLQLITRVTSGSREPP